MQRACEKRNISMNVIEEFLDELERDLRETGKKEIPSNNLGEKIMKPLHKMDGVAYVRFASVYREFKDVNDFVSELKNLLSKARNPEHPAWAAVRHRAKPRNRPKGPGRTPHERRIFHAAGPRAGGKGRGCTAPDPMVGAVVVKDGKVVGQGYHRALAHAYAEVDAIAAAGAAACGADLYVTLEPATTPAGRRRAPRRSYRPASGGSSWPSRTPIPMWPAAGSRFLEARGVEASAGSARPRPCGSTEVFVKFVRTRRPFVALKCAATSTAGSPPAPATPAG